MFGRFEGGRSLYTLGLPAFDGALPLFAGGFTFRLPGFVGEDVLGTGGRLPLFCTLPVLFCALPGFAGEDVFGTGGRLLLFCMLPELLCALPGLFCALP